MIKLLRRIALVLLIAASCAAIWLPRRSSSTKSPPAGRDIVVFWHFWGGTDRAVVDGIVRRFNDSQSKYWVRAVAVPGNNLDAKLFMSVAGGNPPDLVNQDDPVLADWSARSVLQAVDEFAGLDAVAELDRWLLPAARCLAQVDGRYVAVPNGLDVRMLYYNASLLHERNLRPPNTLAEFDRLIGELSPPGDANRDWFAFLPDPRRIWAWGYVFGGQFYDPARRRVTVDSRENAAALAWMQRFSRAYGPDAVARFRQADQSLPGKTFPLLPSVDEASVGRYAFVLDGQWRTRDIEAFVAARAARNIPAPQFGACPLPPPDGGRAQSGWVNGNFFVVPRGAKNPAGAWAFMRFWIGLADVEQAASTCADGGWIPVSSQVIQSAAFQEYLKRHPLMAKFVELAASDQLFPYPSTRGAMFFKRTLEAAAEQALSNPGRPTADILREANQRIQSQLERTNAEER
jgi:multiple sugar transport system substrate-binding protein